ncbi:MAG: Bifunctional oligoribonuclease and PAP phosphatase NrnA [Phycisphaerae bacterium]|nr:Bifunctional oligoribonuclease and PAP phosphatase NrnA [Phycisphaerae bacterium]
MNDALDALRTMDAPLLVGHQVPDADCIGSLLGLALAMRNVGKRPRVILSDGDVSQRLAFLPGFAAEVERAGGYSPRPDWIVALDTAAAKRINAPEKLATLSDPPPLLNIDHHQTNEKFGSANWVVPEAGSTSELVGELLEALGWPITAPIATLLYAGIYEDTLGFSLPGVSERALAGAARLVGAGADVALLGEKLVRSQTMSEFRLLKTVYDNTRLSAAGRLAWSTVSHGEFVASGCAASDIDNQVAVPRNLVGVQVAMLFSEAEPGNVRINFRGKGDTEVISLAKRFNGGGHRQSAGARILGRFDEVVAAVVSAAEAHVAAALA